MIETKGLGAGSYPEPTYEETKIVKGTICIEYNFEVELPSNWDNEKIQEDIKNNLSEYISDSDYEIADIDI